MIVVQPRISRVNSMGDLLMLYLRLMVEYGDQWNQRVNSSRELCYSWLLFR